MASITKIPFTTDAQRGKRAPRKGQPRIFQAIAETAGTLHQAQTLPRLRLNTIISFLILVSFIAGVSSMFLFMESQIGLVGREVLKVNGEMLDIRLKNEDLMTQLSSLRSVKLLNQRAIDLGFELIDPANVTYIYVPGFVGADHIDLSEDLTTNDIVQLDPAYTESLFSWLLRAAESASAPLSDL